MLGLVHPERAARQVQVPELIVHPRLFYILLLTQSQIRTTIAGQNYLCKKLCTIVRLLYGVILVIKYTFSDPNTLVLSLARRIGRRGRGNTPRTSLSPLGMM